MSSFQHIPVLLEPLLAAFSAKTVKIFVDATLGAAGHAEAILKAHPEIELFYGLDQDPVAINLSQERLKPFGKKVRFENCNFSELSTLNLSKVDGILADIGVSSMQIDQPGRGFSFMREGPLDMRMDPKNALTAEEIVNTWSEKDLVEIFFKFGEERHSRKIAKAISQRREDFPFKTTVDLSAFIASLPLYPKEKIHPATRIFQALRIQVNGELEALKKFLEQAVEALNSQGRLAIITFHSLEDRLVKHFFSQLASDKESTSSHIPGMFIPKIPKGKVITTKAIVPSLEEVAQNPRSRSAKLRIFEKL